MMKKIFQWVVYSSKDPSKVALTVKTALTFAVTYGTVVAGFGHIVLPTEDLTTVVNAITTLVQQSLEVVSASMFIWGLGRKIYATVKGQHWVFGIKQSPIDGSNPNN